MAENLRKLDELRRSQSEHGNHLVDELLAGRLSRRQFVRRGSVMGLSAVSLAGILAACGGANNSGGSGSSASSGDTGVVSASSASSASSSTPAKKGGTIKIGQVVPTAGIEPPMISDQGGLSVASLAGEYLTQAQQDLTLRSQLATKWEPSTDAKTWTFTLVPNATFHDGAKMTAADVVFTFDLLTDPKGGSAALSAFAGILSKGNIEAQGDTTVVFHLDTPNANFPYLVCSQIYNCIVLPKTYDGDFEKTFNGTGPFKLVKYTPKQGASFERNPNYWDATRQPLLDGADLRFFEGEPPQILALQGGEVDLLNQISFQGGRALFTASGIQIIPTRAASHRQIHMRVDMDPFKDKRVRQAIALCLNRPNLITQLFAGKADIGNDTPFWSGYPSSDPSVPQREEDIAKAKALMAAAGMKGFEVTLTTERVVDIPDLAVQVQQAVKPIGGNIKLKIVTPTQYFGTGKPGQTPWLEVPMGIVDYGHRPTPNVYLGAPLQTGGIWNAAHFSDKAYDDLVKQWSGEVDVQKAKTLAGQIEKLLLDETPLMIPYFFNYLAAGTSKVQGYKADATGLTDLRETSLA